MKPVLAAVVASLLSPGAGGCNVAGDSENGEPARMASADPAGAAALSPAEGQVSLAPAGAASASPASARRSRSVVRVEGRPTAEQARVARAALAPVFREAAEMTGEAEVDYGVATADLNDDGRDDLIVQVQDQRLCGQWGCQGYAILATPTGFRRDAIQLGVCFNATITVLPSATGGMRDLEYDRSGEADRTAGISRWNGRTYEGGCLDLD